MILDPAKLTVSIQHYSLVLVLTVPHCCIMGRCAVREGFPSPLPSMHDLGALAIPLNLCGGWVRECVSTSIPRLSLPVAYHPWLIRCFILALSLSSHRGTGYRQPEEETEKSSGNFRTHSPGSRPSARGRA